MTQMGSFLVCISFLFLACSGSVRRADHDYFEGSITYDIEATSKSDKYAPATLQLIAGDSTVYYYKEGNNRMVTPESYSPVGIYRVADNKAYTIRKNRDTVYWEFCGRPGSGILSAVITPRKETVLGILCDELKVVYKNKTVTSYYNSDTLRINPALHKKNTISNENYYAEKKKALSLKFIIDVPDFTLTYTATRIEHAALDNKLFEIPPGMPLVEIK